MIASVLNAFLQWQVLVGVGGLLSWVLRLLVRRNWVVMPARAERQIHLGLVALMAILLVMPSPKQEEFTFAPIVRVVESAPAVKAVSSSPMVVTQFAEKHSAGWRLDWISWAALALLLAGLGAVARDYFRLYRLLRNTHVIRRIGRVQIAVHDAAPAPFSTRGWGRAWVVLPSSFIANPHAARVAVLHELQHHRSGDTLWCHVAAPLRAFCFFHPLRVLWWAVIAEVQELACDEFLVNQKVSAREYSECLLSAAELAGRRGAGRAYAAAPALFSDRRLLIRRVESMFAIEKKKNGTGYWSALALALVLGSCLTLSAWASSRWLVDSRISEKQMQEMAEKAREATDFPIAVNGAVLAELNYYLGTAKGRDFIKKGLARLEYLRPGFERQLAEHRAPQELLAVGLIESGFQNFPPSANPKTSAAGIWQFVPATARKFGMRVDQQVDERLNVEQEADAAFRYLTQNQQLFSDWQLGVMSYNMGEQAVKKAIAKTGVRDPWELIRLGYENDSRYLAKFMAGVLILKNTHLLK